MERPWDDECGDWQGLSAAKEIPRYKAVAGLIERLCPQGRILDVGCGEALLRRHLSQDTRYFGVEPSGKAAALARERCGADIFHGTAEDFQPTDDVWDCIVFNEVLYYTRDPVGLLRKFAKLLNPQGIMIVSIWEGYKPSLEAWLRYFLDRRRPLSEEHCMEMTLWFIESEGWIIRESTKVATPGDTRHWHICAFALPGL